MRQIRLMWVLSHINQRNWRIQDQTQSAYCAQPTRLVGVKGAGTREGAPTDNNRTKLHSGDSAPIVKDTKVGMANETRGKAAARKHSATHWRMQDIAQESVDSSDEEFFDARDVLEGKSAILLGMSQWNSNDLVEQIETLGHMDQSQESLYGLGRPRCVPQSSIDGLEDMEKTQCKTHVLLLVLHGGNILDTGGGDPGTKAGDATTLSSVLEKVARAHFQAAAEHMMIKLVACPAVCAEAFSLVSNLNPYSYDESCVSSSVDHLPLAALPLLAIAAPHYQDAVATLIARANQVYHSFLASQDGQGFTGSVCLMGDCVGGVLCFDALCFSSSGSSQRQQSSPSSSRDNSTESLKDNPEDSPCPSPSLGLNSSKRLSKSNIDISALPGDGHSQGRQPLGRKQSDSFDDTSTGQHSFFSSLMQDGVDLRPGSSSSLMLNPGKFDFEVSQCFLLGCPLGLVLAMRRTVLPTVQVSHLRPACTQIFNLFYPSDPSASRLEPLLEPLFHKLPPFPMPRYQRYPMGDGRSTLLADSIQSHPEVFLEAEASPGALAVPPAPDTDSSEKEGAGRRASVTSLDSETSVCSVGRMSSTIANISSSWWGSKRMDYALYCPDVLTSFPTVALPHLFHASYWESTDVAAFVLRQLMRCDSVKAQEADRRDSALFSPSSPREKWLRRRTPVKLRNVTDNHRVNDVISTEEGPQTLVGRFMYGPLDMVTLTGEKVDIFLMTQPQSGRWVYFDTEVTTSSGRVVYTLPKSKKLATGVYPIKMVVKGDQTSAEAYLTVLPRGMDCVVFSIDGSFAASVSIMGSDPKVRPGAVDVVRHWQDLGYLIIYITGRPDMQKQRVVSWLSQHNFPQGMIFFSEGLVHDPLRQKTIFLRNLVQECHIKINSAYGSMKDISVYNMLGLSPSQIYIVGRPSKKYQNQCQFLSDGYAVHLSSLQFGHRARPKKTSSVRMVLRKGSFGLSAKPDFLCKRTHLRRTMSVQQPDPPCTPNPKPERAQSQPESDKDPGGGGGGGGGHGVWGRASMHRGDTTP
ncbi:membrane-associated phosphatidylinositol transfer protein 3 isoform X2 [Esox lucius]|uniref:membrane-associated phosphatidylinositol transfer protein 3 isoform X2 n=1 Tax=Esox lucius TaxID=8010 RepID=UPI0014775FCC|nr:membrane-associated phosphatidylinositol transfer protein 3 isoform X2 [Esox lucius]